MSTGWTHITWNDRLTIERMVREKFPVPAIAAAIGKTRQAVYEELRRAPKYHRLDGRTWKTDESYSPEMAQQRYETFLSMKGAGLKIGNDIALAKHLEAKIVEDKYSPEAALKCIRPGSFSVEIRSGQTIRSYIRKGVFLRLTTEHLPCPRRKRNRRIKRLAKRPTKGPSIEKRPKEINDRLTAGHWEMDTVHGKQGKGEALLVLTERFSREELLVKLPDLMSGSVVTALDRLEYRFGPQRFAQVFQSITVDNGSEFADYEGMRKSAFGDKHRTNIYYCHSFSSWERGSNENANRLIRRHIPKGTPLERYTDEDIQRIQDWINRYPRLIHGWKCAEEVFQRLMGLGA